MKCPACGTWYPDQKLFCLSCGDLLSNKDGKVRLGEYLLLEKIGQGGVGVVYRARHEGINQEVAIKLLNHSSFGDTQHMQRFKREMRLHEKLEHPNIIHLIDVLEEGEVMALVMELLRGCSLKEYVIHKGEMPLGEIIYVAKAVLSALAVAHEQNIIHRDLKPSNIFLTDQGEVRLMDFGLAKSTTSNDDITGSGITVGTYLYMAPEQILGKEIGAFTDLYAFGIVLYRMATGILPFMSTGGGEFEIMEKQVRHQAEHPKKLNSNIPDALDDLIMHLLQKTPEKRPKDCAEVMSCIEALGEPQRVSVDLADMQKGEGTVSTLSDLNQTVMEQEQSTAAMIEAEEEEVEEDITDTISYNTLLGAFLIESPAAPESPPFDMRHPPALSRDTLTHLRKAIAKIPPLPEVWYEVQAIFDDIESSPADLAKVIAQDAVLTANILEICNSAAYLPAGAKPVTDVALALARVGMGGAEALILGEIIPEFGGIKKSSKYVRRLWFHGQAIAMIASTLSDYSQVVDSQSATMFGLLHDIGKLVILHAEPDDKLDKLKSEIHAGKDVLSAELDVLGYSHIDAGMMLALHWKLPRKVHRFIYYHHFPCWQSPQSWPPDIQASTMLIHISHLCLSSLLAEEHQDVRGMQVLAAPLSHVHDGIWQDNFRSHVPGSESIMRKPLNLPITDASLYSQLRVQVERLQQAFPDLYSDA